MTFDEIMKDLKAGNYKPVYFLYGEESYFIDKITDYILQNALPENAKAFNQIVLYGKDIKVGDINDTARRYPMMADKFLVVVKEAQNIKGLDKLVHYIQNPVETTILVINYKAKSIDKRTKFYKELQKNAVILEAKRLYENQVPKWINKYLESKKIKITPLAAQLLVDHLGTELEKITNELDKLLISLPEGHTINEKDIEKNIGISKDYSIFELQNAIVENNQLKINQIVNHFAANSKANPFIKTINGLYSFFEKVLLVHSVKSREKNEVARVLGVNPYFANTYIKAAGRYTLPRLSYVFGLLHEYDLKAKGVGNTSMPEGELLKEMIFKITH